MDNCGGNNINSNNNTSAMTIILWCTHRQKHLYNFNKMVHYRLIIIILIKINVRGYDRKYKKQYDKKINKNNVKNAVAGDLKRLRNTNNNKKMYER